MGTQVITLEAKDLEAALMARKREVFALSSQCLSAQGLKRQLPGFSSTGYTDINTYDENGKYTQYVVPKAAEAEALTALVQTFDRLNRIAAPDEDFKENILPMLPFSFTVKGK
jgi:hypothetical protein